MKKDKTIHYGYMGETAVCPTTSKQITGTVSLVTCSECKAFIAKRDAERDAAATVERENPRPRLMTINACVQCRWSRDADICTHPDTPGKTGDLGFGDPPIRYRALPLAPSRYGACASSAPPPDWCPLPPAGKD